MVICAYGCGQTATYFMKNGRGCCSAFTSQCPAMRARNNAHRRGIAPFLGPNHPRPLLGKPAWNRGTKLDDLYGPERADGMRAASRAALAANRAAVSADPEKEARRRERISASMRKYGGYRRGSGRGKKGWYRGDWCDSSYELAWVIYNREHGVPFTRNTQKFSYEFAGERRNWMPDFLLPDGTFVEIKGYQDARTTAKFAQFPGRLRVLKQRDMDEIFAFVEGRFGKDFLSLYDRSDPM